MMVRFFWVYSLLALVVAISVGCTSKKKDYIPEKSDWVEPPSEKPTVPGGKTPKLPAVNQ